MSGLAIEERYHHMTGVKTQATEILRSVPADRPAARLARKVVRELATGLETLACCVSPDGIVLGGSVGVVSAPFLPSLQEQIAPACLSGCPCDEAAGSRTRCGRGVVRSGRLMGARE